jgi:Fe-Mn family superoxide dismutase
MFQVPDLPYAYNALDPYIDEQTMRLHHDKHHISYVEKLNKALEGKDEFLSMDINDLMKNINTVPEDVRTAVRNNGGGHANHSLFWTVMTPNGGEVTGELAQTLTSLFGDFSSFQDKFTQAAAGVFGSGWAWLVAENNSLKITTTPNQDSPLMTGQTPILGLDVWEHAYYLKYQNKRPEYIDAWWHVVNWQEVEKRFSEAKHV